MLSPQESLNSANKLKDAGNEAFKKEQYDDALECYTKAIETVIDDIVEKAVFYKNRAAVYLKLEEYEYAKLDCDLALELSPNDPKALFRRCQAYEAMDKIDLAYADAKLVHNLDPKNKAIEPVLIRLHKAVQAKLAEMAKTSNKVKNMFDIVFNLEADNEKREKAADNLIVLARERAGAELLYKDGVVTKIARLLKVEKDRKIRLSCVRVFGELAKKDIDRAKAIMVEAGVPFFMDTLNSKDEEMVNAASYAIQCLLDSISRFDLVKQWNEKKKDQSKMKNDERKQMRKDEEMRQEIMKQNAKELNAMMHVVTYNTVSRTMTGKGRDALLNLIMTNCPWDRMGWAEKMLKTDAYTRLMEVASELDHYKHESAMEITDSTNTIVGICFGHLYEQMWDDERRNLLIEKIDEFSKQKLMDPSLESKVRISTAITTLLKHAPDLGNSQLTKEGFLQMLLAMAQSEEYIEQLVASEALIAATAKKKDATAIINQGMEILKTLYKSKNDHIKVRALVGMCKLGSSGGHDASIRPLAEGSSEKLAEACRRFLVNPSKDRDLRKWAAEGLAFLTLDADVKEKLVDDEPAVKALIELGKTGSQDVMYGVITVLVNLTNSYDKQEITEEMLQLAKFAKHHVPTEHELDDQDFVDKRIYTLCTYGATSALVALSKTESKNMKELIARVINAFCKHHELRGLVVQQGGSKALVPIALNCTEKGQREAAQALARIGITQDPTIAFPGQRSCDVVRPISKLLKEDVSAMQNFEALMALGNLATVNEAVRGRMMKETDVIMAIEGYMYEEHQMLRRAAVQCYLNLCQSPVQVKRCEGNNDRVKYLVLLCGDGDDMEVVKAAAGSLAMLSSQSSKVCSKVFESKQWEECFLNLLANTDYEITYRGVVIVDNMVLAGKEVAEPLLDGKIMNVLQALIMKAKLDEGNYEKNPLLQKIRSVCEHALNTAYEMKVIKTYVDAVKEDEDDETLEPWSHHPAPPPAVK